MSLEFILDDLRTGLRRRSERRRRVRTAAAVSAAALVIGAAGLSGLRQSETPTGAPASLPAATFIPVSGDCFTTLAACGLSSGRI